jgi:hypothetical protein
MRSSALRRIERAAPSEAVQLGLDEEVIVYRPAAGTLPGGSPEPEGGLSPPSPQQGSSAPAGDYQLALEIAGLELQSERDESRCQRLRQQGKDARAARSLAREGGVPSWVPPKGRLPPGAPVPCPRSEPLPPATGAGMQAPASGSRPPEGKRLNKSQFERLPQPQEGDCFFHCVESVLGVTVRDARRMIWEQLALGREFFDAWTENPPDGSLPHYWPEGTPPAQRTPEQWLLRCNRFLHAQDRPAELRDLPIVYASHCEMQALLSALPGLEIRVYLDSDTEADKYLLHEHLTLGASDGVRPILHVWHGGSFPHYDLLVPSEDAEGGAPRRWYGSAEVEAGRGAHSLSSQMKDLSMHRGKAQAPTKPASNQGKRPSNMYTVLEEEGDVRRAKGSAAAHAASAKSRPAAAAPERRLPPQHSEVSTAVSNDSRAQTTSTPPSRVLFGTASPGSDQSHSAETPRAGRPWGFVSHLAGVDAIGRGARAHGAVVVGFTENEPTASRVLPATSCTQRL